jgi:hypothetical protein
MHPILAHEAKGWLKDHHDKMHSTTEVVRKAMCLSVVERFVIVPSMRQGMNMLGKIVG